MAAFKRGDIQNFWEGGRNLYGGLSILWGDLKSSAGQRSKQLFSKFNNEILRKGMEFFQN